MQVLLQEVRSWLKTHPTVTAEAVSRHLNPLIRGWAMYYRHVVSKPTFQHVDYHSWRALWHLVKRRHPRKPRRWLYRRYFEGGKYGATFYAENGDRRGKTIRRRLERMPTIPMVRHVKVQGNASPDDPTLKAYWEGRRFKMGRQRLANGSTRYVIAEALRWQCPGCGQVLFNGEEGHLHHRMPVHTGGSDAQRTSSGSTQRVSTNSTSTVSPQINRPERHAGKLARAVRRGGGDGDTASLPDCPLCARFRQRMRRSVIV